MSAQADWVGDTAEKPAQSRPMVFNPKPARTDERDALRATLRPLIDRIPPGVAQGSVQRVAEWRGAREAAAKVARSPRSSGQELRSAINNMQRFW